jgi:hypothetical protein
MTDDFQKQAAIAHPQNMGKTAGADSIGTVGTPIAARCCGCSKV